MRYLLIDPTTQTIAEGEHVGQIDWRVLRKLIGGSITSAGRLPSGDILWVDDEGLLKGTSYFFHIPTVNGQPLAGVGVITGPEDFLPPGREPGEEEISDAKTTLDDATALITFLDRMKVTNMQMTERHEGGVTHISITPTIEPA